MKKIYLAGGMGNNWRKKIINAFRYYELGQESYNFYDPTEHKLSDADSYTFWDLEAIKDSDIILGYMDSDNPSGYGLNLELGYAKALGKIIIFVMHPSMFESSEQKRLKYLGMATSVADVYYTDLKDAIEFLEELERIN